MKILASLFATFLLAGLIYFPIAILFSLPGSNGFSVALISVVPAIVFGYVFYIFIQKNNLLTAVLKKWLVIKFCIVCVLVAGVFILYHFFSHLNDYPRTSFKEFFLLGDSITFTIFAILYGVLLPVCYRTISLFKVAR